jgi:hypothetical protein
MENLNIPHETLSDDDTSHSSGNGCRMQKPKKTCAKLKKGTDSNKSFLSQLQTKDIATLHTGDDDVSCSSYNEACYYYDDEEFDENDF